MKSGVVAILKHACPLLLCGSPPAWWALRSAVVAPQVTTNSGVVTTNYIFNDYAVVTQGQLKQFTARAVDELNANLPGGAGTNLNTMVSNWVSDYATNGYSATHIKPSDYTAMTVGQLKYIGNKVWAQLVAGGYTNAVPAWLALNTNSDNAMANLGQLKTVFNFDLSSMGGGTPTVPDPVTNLTASNSNPNEIDLSWTLPTGDTATSILIERSSDGGATWTTVATLSDPTSTTYADTNLTPGQSYIYRVTNTNSTGSSPPSGTTDPTSVKPAPRYAVIDLGAGVNPSKITGTGYVLMSTNSGAGYYRWFNGVPHSLQSAPGSTSIPLDITEDSTVVGLNMSTNFDLAQWATNSDTATEIATTYSVDTFPGPPVLISPDHTRWSTQGGNISGTGPSDGHPPFADGFKNGTRLGNTEGIPTPPTGGFPSYTGFSLEPFAVNGSNHVLLGKVQWTFSTNVSIRPDQQVGICLDTVSQNIPFQAKALNNASPPIIVGTDGTNAIWWDGSPHSLGGGRAVGVNAATNFVNGAALPGTQIIGYDNSGNGVLWEINPTNSVFNSPQYLNDLVTNTGWSNVGANFINDYGAIVGTATKSGTSHGVMLVPNYITRDGLPVNSTNNTVWVGQQINLTNYVSTNIPPSAITSYQWNIPGATNGTAFYDYKPTSTSSNYTNLFTPTNYTTNSSCNFYWSSGGSNQVVTCTEIIYGKTNTVSATFNVSRPNAAITTTHGTITVGTNDSSNPGRPYLYFGDNPPATPGMAFTNSIPLTNGVTEWVQIIANDTITFTRPTPPPTSRVESGNDAGKPPTFPYAIGSKTEDSPDNPLFDVYASVNRNFVATMYLMWQPSTNMVNGDNTVLVPLMGYQWNWSGTATNNSGTWSLMPGSANYPTNASDVDVTNEPTWSTNAVFHRP